MDLLWWESFLKPIVQKAEEKSHTTRPGLAAVNCQFAPNPPHIHIDGFIFPPQAGV